MGLLNRKQKSSQGEMGEGGEEMREEGKGRGMWEGWAKYSGGIEK